MPAVVRVVAVLPFAICLELLAMALSAMADERMRLGERAYGFRMFSAMVAVVAVGILVAGHWPHLYWSAAFGLLSASAYLLWLLHSAARRRDALRAAGKLADTAPDYGLWRRLRHPVWTTRAAELARHGRRHAGDGWRPLGLFESLRAAELAMRADRRRPAVVGAVEQVVRADQRDPRMAEVAVRTLDLDRLAAELAARVDYSAWADRLAPAITAPAPTVRGGDRAGAGGAGMSGRSGSAPGEAVAAPLPVLPGPVAAAAAPPGGQQHRPSPAPTPVPEPAPVAEIVSVGAPGALAAASANRRSAATGTDIPAPWTAAGHDDGREHRPDASDGCVAEPAPRGDPGPAEPTLETDHYGPGVEDSPGARGAVSAAATAPASLDGTDADDAERDGATPAPATRPATDDSPGHLDVTHEAPAGEPGDRDGDDVVPADTASAVAYWHRRDPSLHPADIAARIGRSERTVRRYWPPTLARSVNGHDTSDLAEDLRAG